MQKPLNAETVSLKWLTNTELMQKLGNKYSQQTVHKTFK